MPRGLNKILVAIIVAAIVIAAVTISFTVRYSEVRVRVTTTTSLYATGLLEYLEEEFKRSHPGVEIDFIPVGSGEALRRAAQGDACLVFVHAPSLEKKYLEQGVLEQHRIIAYNFFVIVGPSDDPAGVRNASNAVDAFKRIYVSGEEGRARFVSRGDRSGTHVKELSLWRLAGLSPQGKPWYMERGAGMADTLVTADELNAYTLSDIGTYLKLRNDGRIRNIEVLYVNDTELINIYSVYLVKTCTGDERRIAEEFARFVYENQDLIAKYGVDEYGQPLFYPARDRESELASIWADLAQSR